MTETPTSTPPTPSSAKPAPNQINHNDLEHRYYQYLRAQEYSTTDALIEVLRWYLPHFEGFSRVLDIGCGHGEFLQLLQEHGHEAVGIDIDPAMVDACHTRGLTAYEADAISWLATQTEQFDAIFSSNVIEHLDAATVQQLVQQAFTALRPGGMLLLGTPNPESFIVQFHEFWRDPTHVRLYGRQLIEFFLADAGFTNIQNGDNTNAAWDGIEIMLNSGAQATPTLAALADIPPMTPLAAPPPLHTLPEPPDPDASLREKTAFRLLKLVYEKFLEPYIALIRTDLENQQHYLRTCREKLAELQETNRQLTHILNVALIETHQLHEQRIGQLENAYRFLSPSRELFVYGYKPGNSSVAHVGDETQRSDTTDETGA